LRTRQVFTNDLLGSIRVPSGIVTSATYRATKQGTAVDTAVSVGGKVRVGFNVGVGFAVGVAVSVGSSVGVLVAVGVEVNVGLGVYVGRMPTSLRVASTNENSTKQLQANKTSRINITRSETEIPEPIGRLTFLRFRAAMIDTTMLNSAPIN